MSDLTKTIDVIFGAKDETGMAIKSVVGQLDGMNKSVDGMSKTLSGATTKVLELAAAVSGATVAAMALSISKASEFGGSFREITTLVDGTSEQMATFKDDVLAYAQGSTKSIADIEQSLYKAISAGVDYEDALGTLSTAEKLSIAGRNELSSTTVLLAGTMNAYGASTAEAGRYSDVFMQTIRQGLTTLPELAASFSNVAGIAALGKVPIETMGAAIAALTSTGMDTSSAITGLKNVISKIIDPSTEAATLAKTLGIEWNASALQAKGLNGVLKEAYEVTGGNAEQMSVLLGGIRGLNAGVILAADSSGKFNAALESMKQATGATKIAYDKMAEGFGLATQNMKNNADVMWISIGSRLIDGARTQTAGIAEVFKSLKIAIDDGAFDDLFDAYDEVMAESGEFAESIAKALPAALSNTDFSGIARALGSVKTALEGLFAGTDTEEAMTDAIQGVVDSLESLILVTKGIAEPFLPLVRIAGECISAFNSLDSTTKVLAGNALGLATSFKMFGPIGLIFTALGTDAEKSSAIINFAFSSIENGINALYVAVVSLGLMFATAALDAAKLLDYVPGYDASEDIKRTSERVAVLTSELGRAEEAYNTSSDKLRNVGTAMKVAATDTSAASAAVAGLKTKMDEIPAEKKTTVKAEADMASAETAKDNIESKLPDGRTMRVYTDVDGVSVTEVVTEIDKTVPSEKKVEIKPDLSKTAVEEIKEKSAIIQKSIEWQAKIDIAQIEAGTKQIEAAFKSVDNTITSTGTTMSSFIDAYVDLYKSGRGVSSTLEDMIEAEAKRRDDAIQMQKDLVKAQVDNLNARTDALRSGSAMIQIDGAGLQPHLEAFMFEILAAIQIRANAEGAQLLVGTGA